MTKPELIAENERSYWWNSAWAVGRPPERENLRMSDWDEALIGAIVEVEE